MNLGIVAEAIKKRGSLSLNQSEVTGSCHKGITNQLSTIFKKKHTKRWFFSASLGTGVSFASMADSAENVSQLLLDPKELMVPRIMFQCVVPETIQEIT